MADIIEPTAGRATVPRGAISAQFRQAITPTRIVSLLLAAVLLFLVANPLFQLVKESFSNPRLIENIRREGIPL